MKICIVIHDRTVRPLTVQTDATSPNIVAPTMLHVLVVWKRMQQLPTKQRATACNRLCKRTQRVTPINVASVCTGLYLKCKYSKAPCKRTQYCWMLHVAFVCTPCCILLLFVAQSLKPLKLLTTLKRTQQFPALLAQQYTRQVLFRAQVKTGLFLRLAKQQLWRRITFFVHFFALVAPRHKTA